MRITLQIDSRSIKPGDIFIAIPGLSSDGRNFIQEAFDNGARAVLAQEPCDDLRAIPIPNLSKRLPELAAMFYGKPANYLKLIGVTGTNGKTSCTNYIAQILDAHNVKCGIMGTLGNGTLDSLVASNLTTVDCCGLQKQLHDFTLQNISHVAMEVSSHALEQDRVYGLDFECAIFTNLSQDHLDYHASMQEYFASKAKLFNKYNVKHSVINLDCVYSKQLMKEVSINSKISTYSLHDLTADYCWDALGLETKLLGDFNKSNILASVASCNLLGVNMDKIKSILPDIKAVPGRMQQVLPELDNVPTVIVDFAHTPDALLNVLETIQKISHNKIYCIFGCGGNRDAKKRPLMLNVALQFSDQVIVTSDNPRNEEPKKIVEDIVSGNNDNPKIHCELDREKAITNCIQNAAKGDIVLIAGKGHEEHQIILDVKYPFSDYSVASKALLKMREVTWSI